MQDRILNLLIISFGEKLMRFKMHYFVLFVTQLIDTFD